MIDEQTTEEYWKMWDEILDKNGLKSLVPVQDLLSRDMTEASLMVDMWIKLDMIIPKILQ